jgi:TIR domain
MPPEPAPVRRRRRPLSLFAAPGAAALVVFAALRAADLLHLLPGGAAAGAALAAALAAGGGAVVVQLLPAGTSPGRRLRRLLLPWLAAAALLLALDLAFVRPVPGAGGDRAGSVVISWSRAGCAGGAEVDCPASAKVDACLAGLAYRQDSIDACWGPGRVLAVELALAACCLLVAGGGGAAAGLGVLVRRSGLPAAPTGPPLRVFLSYRRRDSEAWTSRLYDRLIARYGAERVFKDVQAIPLGDDFRTVVRRAVEGCDIFLAVIGDGWLEARDAAGGRRLERADDPVRVEIETALAASVPVVPLLVGGAAMPDADRLPPSLAPLVDRHGTDVRPDPHFDGDVALLFAALERIGPARPR